jgi:hypothetical protein
MMPRRCSICTHRHVALIDEGLVKSVSYQRLATEFGVSAEARIRESILRKARGQEWRYEGREQDFARVRRWHKERGETLAGGGVHTY